MSSPVLDWDDPFALDSQLSEEERLFSPVFRRPPVNRITQTD